MKVAIGKMDRRITLRRKTITRGAAGGPSESWENVVTVWGQKLDLTGRELIAAQQVEAKITTKFRIRWRSDVNPAWRLSCEGKDYDITGLTEVGRRQWLEIAAEAVAAGEEQDFDDEGSP